MTRGELMILRRQLLNELTARCKLIMAGDPPLSDIREIQLEIAAIDDRIADLDTEAQVA
jgi:hypothetical protein